jgi:hypothetical protein
MLQTRYLQNDQIDMEVDGNKGIVGREEVGGGADGVVDRKMVSEGRCVTAVGGWICLVGIGRRADSRNRTRIH